jgi:septal ring factor EnvC (AmiA/AmiB activator)
MNKLRRAQIEALLGKLNELQGEAQKISDQQQEVFDALPETRKESTKGVTEGKVAAHLDECATSIERAAVALHEALFLL